jgi:hypothetical protein
MTASVPVNNLSQQLPQLALERISDALSETRSEVEKPVLNRQTTRSPHVEIQSHSMATI